MDCGLSYGISYPFRNTNHHQKSIEMARFNYKRPTYEIQTTSLSIQVHVVSWAKHYRNIRLAFHSQIIMHFLHMHIRLLHFNYTAINRNDNKKLICLHESKFVNRLLNKSYCDCGNCAFFVGIHVLFFLFLYARIQVFLCPYFRPAASIAITVVRTWNSHQLTESVDRDLLEFGEEIGQQT